MLAPLFLLRMLLAILNAMSSMLLEKPFGVIILTDSTPGEAEDLGAVKAPSLEPEGECAPPEPFEWAPPGHPEAAPEVEEEKPKEEEKSEDADEKMSTEETKKEES